MIAFGSGKPRPRYHVVTALCSRLKDYCSRRLPLSRTSLASALSAALTGCFCAGCVGGGAPADPYDLGVKRPEISSAGGGSLEGPLPDAGSRDSHFPLLDGATWTYHHTNLVDAPWDETDSVALGELDGNPAFVLEDEEDAQGEQTHSTHVIDGTRVYRAYKEISVADEVVVTTSYDPAFLRYDEAWITSGTSVTLDDDWTQHCLVASSASSCAPGAVKPGSTTHRYTVLDVAAEISVPAGDFTAVKIQRDNVTSPETKLFWFVAGVGKVREENPETGAVTELSSYEIP